MVCLCLMDGSRRSSWRTRCARATRSAWRVWRGSALRLAARTRTASRCSPSRRLPPQKRAEGRVYLALSTLNAEGADVDAKNYVLYWILTRIVLIILVAAVLVGLFDDESGVGREWDRHMQAERPISIARQRGLHDIALLLLQLHPTYYKQRQYAVRIVRSPIASGYTLSGRACHSPEASIQSSWSIGLGTAPRDREARPRHEHRHRILQSAAHCNG